MNRFFPSWCAFSALLFLAGCAQGDVASGPPPYEIVDSGHGPAVIEIQVWSEDHPLLAPYDVVLDGCVQWWPKGVECVLADSSEASMHIDAVTPEDVAGSLDQAEIDMANCTPDAMGKVILAISKGGGWMEFFPKCFEMRDAAGNLIGYDTLIAATVVTHEIGHELGMPHVDRMCVPSSPVIGDVRLCGEAVMNPYLDIRTPAPTPVDDLLFMAVAAGTAMPGTACTYMMDAP